MRYILVIFGVLLFVSITILGFFYIQERKEHDILKARSIHEINQLKAVNEGIKGSLLKSQVYNNIEVPLQDDLILSDLTFCLYISENQCSSCVNATLRYYTSNNCIVSDSNFIVLANFNPNALKHLKVEHQLKCRIVSTYGTNLTIAENKYPCFFIYDRIKEKTDMFLFPLKNEPEMLKKYFENVRDKYFSNILSNE